MGKRTSRKKSKVKIYFVAVLFLLVGLVGLTFYSYFLPPRTEGTVFLTVEQGATLDEIGGLLKDKGVIKSKQIFILHSRLNGYSAGYKAGDYSFVLPISLDEISQALIRGPESEEKMGVKVTIPEGYTVNQIADLLEEKGLGRKNDFLALATEGSFDYSFLNFPKSDAMKYKLEGFLFPDTYFFKKDGTSDEFIRVMLDRFNEVGKEIGLFESDKDILEVVTLASIVEKEAVKEDERAIIAGVFTNRLNDGMKLESCATVQYALGRSVFTPVVTLEEAAFDSPYNTYMNLGLPTGPIASPGKQSLQAALEPEKTEYLYFVARGDGSHIFNTNFEDHNKAAQEYVE